MQRSDLDGIAVHEAAHAVACLHFGWPVSLVTIRPRDGMVGHVRRHWVPNIARSAKDARNEAIMTLAGPIAESMHKTGSVDLAAIQLERSADTQRVRQCVAMSLNRRRAFTFQQAAEDAARLVSNPLIRLAIKWTACELLEQGGLLGSEVERICRPLCVCPGYRLKRLSLKHGVPCLAGRES